MTNNNEKRRCGNCNKQIERGNTVSGWYHTNPNPDCACAMLKGQAVIVKVCGINDQHTGRLYRCESDGAPYYLCEACIDTERMALCEQCNLMCQEESMNCEGPVPICQTCANANVTSKIAEFADSIEAAKAAWAKAIVLDIPDNDQHALNAAIYAISVDMDSHLAVAIAHLMNDSAGDPTDAAIRNVFANARVR